MSKKAEREMLILERLKASDGAEYFRLHPADIPASREGMRRFVHQLWEAFQEMEK